MKLSAEEILDLTEELDDIESTLDLFQDTLYTEAITHLKGRRKEILDILERSNRIYPPLRLVV